MVGVVKENDNRHSHLHQLPSNLKKKSKKCLQSGLYKQMAVLWWYKPVTFICLLFLNYFLVQFCKIIITVVPWLVLNFVDEWVDETHHHTNTPKMTCLQLQVICHALDCATLTNFCFFVLLFCLSLWLPSLSQTLLMS